MIEEKTRRRMSTGKCALCGATVTKRSMAKHLQSCVQEHEDASKGKSEGETARYYQIRAEGYGAPEYWLHIEARADVTLKKLDQLLRDVWLECCGHMSVFRIDGRNYMSYVWEPGDKNMNAKLSAVLAPDLTFTHEYDFGTTTELKLKVLSERVGLKKGEVVRVLARNDPPEIPCDVCGKPATELCTECLWEDTGRFCEEHARAKGHKCDEEMLLPVVNSPRVGMCAYTGEEG